MVGTLNPSDLYFDAMFSPIKDEKDKYPPFRSIVAKYLMVPLNNWYEENPCNNILLPFNPPPFNNALIKIANSK